MMMNVIHLVFFGLGMACIGVMTAFWLRGAYLPRKIRRDCKVETRFAGGILASLRELAIRLAWDVDEHSNKIE
jgi:hypothetical protein